MLILILILFSLAAIGGIVLLTYVLLGKNTPKAIVLAHGGIAALALVLLIITAIYLNSILWIGVIVFAIVALVGGYLFSRDILGKKIPGVIAVMHGVGAFIGIIILIVLIANVY